MACVGSILRVTPSPLLIRRPSSSHARVSSSGKSYKKVSIRIEKNVESSPASGECRKPISGWFGITEPCLARTKVFASVSLDKNTCGVCSLHWIVLDLYCHSMSLNALCRLPRWSISTESLTAKVSPLKAMHLGKHHLSTRTNRFEASVPLSRGLPYHALRLRFTFVTLLASLQIDFDWRAAKHHLKKG